MNWPQREKAMLDLAQLIESLPCSLTIVECDKSHLTDYVRSDESVYRIAFTRLLDLVNMNLVQRKTTGLLMLDTRSDLHSSVQDRRIIDTYLDWQARQTTLSKFLERPWFGFSSFYPGLQIADFCAYVFDFKANEYGEADERGLVSHITQRITSKLVYPVAMVP